MANNFSNIDNFFDDVNSIVSNKNTASVSKSNFNPNDIIEKAKKLNIKIHPLDIEQVVKQVFGISIIEEKFDKNVSGFIENINGKWLIYLNKYESVFRKRFTIAHELAHFIKHKDNYLFGSVFPDKVFFRDSVNNSIEREANDFAAELLMPKDVFIKEIEDGCNTIEKLADKFQLSTSAVRYRAYKLGLIPEYD